ncbi:hypothetical protein [Amycolatopsis jiangsuensis]|uniref:GerMN domain-containing protein n=1 Tax=Amycolatopsis jiangsuensis TaxID=1181879 RepID=A0A840IV25_9PSEU|nr:hypothetical protein [Amycolatopsis jiangsuensis]MBB4685369.1 hypothetical protein [Amycolatopsis jiangsuensis]
MKRIWPLAAALLLTGCGVEPSGPEGRGEAPTGVAPGVTLYFVDVHRQLRPQLRETGQLGTIPEAVSLLLTGPGPDDSELHTEIAGTTVTQVRMSTAPDLLRIGLPLTVQDVTARGIDQIVCTALGVQIQSGGSPATRVQVDFVQPTPASDQRRTCPLFS